MKKEIDNRVKLVAGVVFCLVLGLLPVLLVGEATPLVVLDEASLVDGVTYDAWVGFKDKGSLSAKEIEAIHKKLLKEFDPRAIERRKLRRTSKGLFDIRDYPIYSEYLAGVAKAGAKIRVKSRWLNGVTILADKKQIGVIKALPYVKVIGDFHKPMPKKTFKITWETDVPAKESNYYGRCEKMVNQLGLTKLHKAGFAGKGVVVAVIDTAFDLSHKAFNHPKHPLRVAAQWDFVDNDDDVIPVKDLHYTHYSHGTMVLSSIAGYDPYRFVGTAPDAEYILCNAEFGENEFYLEEKWFVAALEFAEKRGAHVLTTSLVLYGGYTQDQVDGKTSIMTKGMNFATANGVICMAPSGNSGQDPDPFKSRLTPPGDALDVITVGAVDNKGGIADFSGDGPTVDGRMKPEVLALGFRTPVVAIENKQGYFQASGTSLSTPVMAGAVACLLQAHPKWTIKELRKALFESGDYFRQYGKADPHYIRGYGIPDLSRAAALK